ncbi:MAG: N-acetylneuraminate synthase family protein, partial [Patescibacteria group bacterium]
IAGRKIGPGFPSFLIAEIGCNHNGDINLAYKLVEAAALAGADCVKVQVFTPSLLVTEGQPQRAMLEGLTLTNEEFAQIKALTLSKGMVFLASVFDDRSVAFLNRLGVEGWKLGSGELTNLPFLQKIAKYNQPMIVSCGMGTLGEVEAAINVIEAAGNSKIVLLHCVSSYPCMIDEINLRAMLTLAAAFQYPVGFSDHSVVLEASVAAVALGASVIERHLTLDKDLPGPDHAASLTPEEFKQMVQMIRNTEVAMGTGRKTPQQGELATRSIARKSLVARQVIHAGQIITREMVDIKRPGTGLSPDAL